MHAKTNSRPAPAPKTVRDTDIDTGPKHQAPASNLSAAFGNALGGASGKPQFPAGKGAPHRPDQINKAPKPVGGANRTMSPRRGHR